VLNLWHIQSFYQIVERKKLNSALMDDDNLIKQQDSSKDQYGSSPSSPQITAANNNYSKVDDGIGGGAATADGSDGQNRSGIHQKEGNTYAMYTKPPPPHVPGMYQTNMGADSENQNRKARKQEQVVDLEERNQQRPPLAGENVMNVIIVSAECAPWSKTGSFFLSNFI
jgi:hypothetical protein